MTEKKNSSQPQHQWKEVLDTLYGSSPWAAMQGDGVEGAKALFGRLGKLELAGAEQVDKAIDEGVRLMRESLDLGWRLAATWRKSTIELTEASVQAMSPGA